MPRALNGADDALGTFHPGKFEDIGQALVHNWAHDPWAMACERISYQPGQLFRFWPEVIEPHGRIHFAGALVTVLRGGATWTFQNS